MLLKSARREGEEEEQNCILLHVLLFLQVSQCKVERERAEREEFIDNSKITRGDAYCA
jgi:hypothetical protein